jgi:hypothetical protein
LAVETITKNKIMKAIGEIYKLNKTLKAKLDRINKRLNKFGGRSLTEKEAIRFNIDNNCESGFEAGDEAFDLANATEKKNASSNDYYLVGVGLYTISEKVTKVPIDIYQSQLEKILENSPYK